MTIAPEALLPPLTDHEALSLAASAGFTSPSHIVTIVAIAHAESALVPNARFTDPDGSVDRGILQINSRWHPEWSDHQCDDPATAFHAGYIISSHGSDFTPWSTYLNGSYRQYVPQVQRALQGQPLPSPSPWTPQPPPAWSMRLQPWDFWQQTRDPAKDGDPGSGPNASDDCGPECLSMAVAHLTGVVLDADYILDCMKGPAWRGYTSLQDLHHYLKTYCRTHSSIDFPASSEAWLWRIWKALTRNHVAIPLFSLTAPGASDGHFRCVVAMSSQATLHTADPATGQEGIESWDTAYSWAKGPMLIVHRSRSIAP